ncbi:bifunctional indole-3-glycerol-phosphate synthase TrpC/phosphoribosylanthranilate isomerase TrpF [Veillonella intestinalis]|uniref:bifunctional indole-3-glycerol-phosphate synthase TrpC/phosphoribosylanthranilate isomerase TrpF n=1 Tax=Veillonella intestinalis TaxID=2941341 RepID=UPI0020416C36|nr:bifunctional indole-3-glycerol-phosphate synthase TrpC/phosphoribosylanthranilate isomerase TrpF [Veillonella intestinalis]
MILDTIVEATRRRITKEKSERALEELKVLATSLADSELSRGPFSYPFEKALRASDMNFICEIKKASPSKGVIAPSFPFEQIAKEYEEAGAAAISILTEPEFFKGHVSYLMRIREQVTLPLLQKDFFIDEYQIYGAKVYGAQAILLICAILTDEELQRFYNLADSLGLSCLVETHSAEEIERALAIGARIIGVNNRDLRDFTVHIKHSLELRHLVPPEVIFVSESGLECASHIQQLREHHIQAALIGEHFMRAPNKKAALSDLYGRTKPVMTKICGLKRLEDIAIINELAIKPQYVGFVFAKSSRQVTAKQAKALADCLTPGIQKVGVFVEESVAQIMEIVKIVPLDVVQVCGAQAETTVRALQHHLSIPIWRAVSLQSKADLMACESSQADLLLFDTYKQGYSGGTGETFDWTLLEDCKRPYFLAGGLGTHNIARAIRQVQPYGVDISSGVETNRVKDKIKIEQFLQTVSDVTEADR